MGRLTTHVLDIANGCPGAGIRVELFRVNSAAGAITSTVTNSDGRCDAAMLEGDKFTAGEYELVFHVGDYFNQRGQNEGDNRFLNRIPIRFGINQADEHYHVPLLVSPFGYSTYRGS